MGNVASTEASPIEASQSQRPRPSALVIVGPSGVGKGTLIDRLREGNDDYGFSCSHTTRKPRAGEQSGVHYHFTDRTTFEAEIAAGKFLEYAYVHNNIYGTSVAAVEEVTAAGKCCILDIDVQGARQVRGSGLRAIFVFIAPPSIEELERRLRGRGTEAEEQITSRLLTARSELASIEEQGLYDHVLVNSDIETCLKELQAVATRALAGEVGPPNNSPTAGAPRDQFSDSGSLRVWMQDPVVPAASPVSSAVSPTVPGTLVVRYLGDSGGGLAQWKGSVALVTGATGSLGKGITLALLASGIRVVAIARRKDRLESLQESFVATGYRQMEFLPIVCDVTKEAEVSALPRIVSKNWSGAGIDILINAAASGPRHGIETSLISGAAAAWVESVSVGVMGTALVTREVIQDLKQRGKQGHIVHITCRPSEEGSSGMAAVASAAVRAMAGELRKEIAREKLSSLRVSCIETGALEENPESSNGMLSAQDVVASVLHALSAPPHADISEIKVHAVKNY